MWASSRSWWPWRTAEAANPSEANGNHGENPVSLLAENGWDRMSEVVAVLGGGGFLGSAIVDRLLAEGHAVRVLERPRIKPHRPFRRDERIDWIEGDFSYLPDVQLAMKGVSAVVHLVCTTRPKSSNAEPIYDVQSNVVTTLKLLEEMRILGIKKLVFASSGGTVYGQPLRTPIDEDHPTNPTTFNNKIFYHIFKSDFKIYFSFT